MSQDGASEDASTGSSSGAPVCEGDFEPEPPGPAVEVTVRNDSEAVVYLDVQFPCVSSYLELEDDAGESFEWRTDGWLLACEDLAAGCGGPGCIASAVRLEPGAVYTETWPGFVFELQSLGAECLVGVSEDCGDTCYIERNPPAGTYNLGVRYTDTADCGEEDCAELCEVDLGPGTCELFYADQDILGERTTLRAAFAHPTTSAVALTIE